MFKFFKKSTEIEKLQKKYQVVMQAAFELSKSDRKGSDQKTAEANEILQEIEKLARKTS